MFFKKILYVILLNILFFSCTQSPPESQIAKSSKLGKNKSVKSAAQSEEGTSNINPEDKIDGSALYVVKVQVVDLSDKGEMFSLLKYEYDGLSDYVYYKICPLEAVENPECVENVNNTSGFVILPYLEAGEVQVAVRACVDKEKAIDESSNCGNWSEIVYNSRAFDREKAELLKERDRVMDAIADLAEDYYRDLREYVKEAEKCQIRDTAVAEHLKKKTGFVNLVLKAPMNAIKDSVKSGASGLTKAAGVDPGTVRDNYIDFRHDLQKSMAGVCESMGQGVCNGGRMISEMGSVMGTAFNPVHSIGTLSGAIHDLTTKDPNSLVKRGCHVDEILAKRQLTLESLYYARIKRLEDIKTLLQQKGL